MLGTPVLRPLQFSVMNVRWPLPWWRLYLSTLSVCLSHVIKMEIQTLGVSVLIQISFHDRNGRVI